MTITIIKPVVKCDRCDLRPAQEDHLCPFLSDVHGDHETLCNCCTECEHTCCEEV